jgi:hypothetical protein
MRFVQSHRHTLIQLTVITYLTQKLSASLATSSTPPHTQVSRVAVFIPPEFVISGALDVMAHLSSIPLAEVLRLKEAVRELGSKLL